MRNKRVITLIGVVGLAAIIAVLPFVGACAEEAPAPTPTPKPTPAPTPTPTPVEPKEEPLPTVEIKMNGIHAAGSIWTEWGLEYPARLIEEVVPRAKVTTYPGNVLGAYKDAYLMVQEGICDFTIAQSAMTPGAFPTHEIIEQPFLFTNIAVSNAVTNELERINPIMLEEFSPKVKYISAAVLLRPDIHSTKPIRSLAELKGKVIGCTGGKFAEVATLLGAQATLMNISDLYLPLERGVIDGALTAWGVIDIWKLHEVAKYHTYIGSNPDAYMFAFFNRDTWDKFTPEEQVILERTLRLHMQYACNQAATLSQMNVLEKYILAEDTDHEMIYFSQEDIDTIKETVEPMRDKWADELEEKGLPGRKILDDALRFVDGYTAG